MDQNKKLKCILGISGGVDSSTTLLMLLKQNIEVIAVSMTNSDVEKQKRDIANAKRICDKFGVKHKVIDMRKEFKDKVISRFIDDYENGRTPNPCAICNREVKFKMLIDELKKENADFVATGHYSDIVKLDNGRFAIKKCKTAEKDQSYLLYNLTQEQLKYIRFPLYNMNKKDVRNIMKDFDADTSVKKDSFDLCFVENMDYKEYIKEMTLGENYKYDIANGKDVQDKKYLKKGRFIDINGNVLGMHDGIINYTIGQRKGLNKAFGERKYVLDINSDTLDIILCDDDELYKNEFEVKEVNYQAIENFEEGKEYRYICKVRYRDKGSECIIVRRGDILHCTLLTSARAITKGQVAVFYDENDITICGGIICNVKI